VLPPLTGGVEAGFFSFTEITDGAHRAYNQWHQLDHLPEQMPIPGISFGQRWVSSPPCAALTRASPELAVTHYVTLYLLHPPLDDTIREFYDLASQLHAEDRFFSQRRAIASGPLDVLATFVAPRVRVSAAALPHRPSRGVYVVVEEHVGSVEELVEAIEGVAGVAGVAGAWVFGSEADRDQRVSREQGRKLSGGVVTVIFLDEDPLELAPRIDKALEPSWESRGVQPGFAGPLESIIPWSWDWFEQ
jgi:hypothetical protein